MTFIFSFILNPGCPQTLAVIGRRYGPVRASFRTFDINQRNIVVIATTLGFTQMYCVCRLTDHLLVKSSKVAETWFGAPLGERTGRRLSMQIVVLLPARCTPQAHQLHVEGTCLRICIAPSADGAAYWR
ncbi:hypothetical protein ZHAS_00013541 [Anopheles sinensis]|uniref:Uncharacterized protein n=1 Tax=Anopheles sinensis TaxID=74873 RepID=A0A084W637_ANOSI|nr:hypothetical protein ZHAS_00013541 [Anopheles sinensis]